MKPNITCYICEDGKLTSRVDTNGVEYKDLKGFIDYHYYACDSCGSEVVSPELASLNKEIMQNFIASRKRAVMLVSESTKGILDEFDKKELTELGIVVKLVSDEEFSSYITLMS